MPEMGCQELVELVTDYLEGALEPEARRDFEAHLAVCHGCDEYLVQFRRTIVALGSVHELELPPALRQGLLDAFRSRRPA
jgi:anti-sigma factor RsiW